MNNIQIIFGTNIDKYSQKFKKQSELYTYHKIIPRKGEKVEVDYIFQNKEIVPFNELEVADVTYSTGIIKVELHYSDLQLRIAKESEGKIKLYD